MYSKVNPVFLMSRCHPQNRLPYLAVCRTRPSITQSLVNISINILKANQLIIFFFTIAVIVRPAYLISKHKLDIGSSAVFVK